MNEQSQDLKDLLLQTDEEFHQLAAKHHELEDRLHELTAKHYLSEPEQVEEVTLKKRKLQLKDQMEDILRARIGRLTHDPHGVSQLRVRSAGSRARAANRVLALQIAGSMIACASIPPACRSSAARCFWR